MWLDVHLRIDIKNILKTLKNGLNGHIERETMPASNVSVIEGHFTWIIATRSYVNPRQVYK
jgi:hypothetical protein